MCFVCTECDDAAAAFIEKRYPETQIIIRKYLCGRCLEKLGNDVQKIANFVRIVKQ